MILRYCTFVIYYPQRKADIAFCLRNITNGMCRLEVYKQTLRFASTPNMLVSRLVRKAYNPINPTTTYVPRNTVDAFADITANQQSKKTYFTTEAFAIIQRAIYLNSLVNGKQTWGQLLERVGN